jgi:hypothetical protein
VTWRVLTTPASEPDFRALTAQDRASVVEDLFAWVEHGPPRSGSRQVRGSVLFDDSLPCGYTVSYFVNEADRYVAVVRLRRSMPG